MRLPDRRTSIIARADDVMRTCGGWDYFLDANYARAG
jgi:hypothetical protein